MRAVARHDWDSAQVVMDGWSGNIADRKREEVERDFIVHSTVRESQKVIEELTNGDPPPLMLWGEE